MKLACALPPEVQLGDRAVQRVAVLVLAQRKNLQEFVDTVSHERTQLRYRIQTRLHAEHTGQPGASAERRRENDDRCRGQWDRKSGVEGKGVDGRVGLGGWQ